VGSTTLILRFIYGDASGGAIPENGHYSIESFGFGSPDLHLRVDKTGFDG
jgi:hypothetical protein